MVHVLHVVVVLQGIDELFHVLDVPGIGELDVVLGDHLQKPADLTNLTSFLERCSLCN